MGYLELNKDESVQDVVQRLTMKLGADFFQVQDYWDADLWAIGLAAPNNSQVLAYISTGGHVGGLFSFPLSCHPTRRAKWFTKMLGVFQVFPLMNLRNESPHILLTRQTDYEIPLGDF
ncbi:MAG: hypothetical protein K1Y36_09625 [Blastocatellia bacterium]|nr:hypothetical protein [Blastocatellia bacterium]